jgi:hypothetical protein
MSRNAAAVGALVLVGGLLWLVTAWPTPEDDRPDPLEAEPLPPAAAAPQAEETPAPVIGAPPKAPEPVAAREPQAEPPKMRQPHVPDDDMFAKDQGPVAEYKQLYETEPRDSVAHDTESAIRAAFTAADGAPDLFKSVLCRQTVCKVELRWSVDRLGAYVAGITRATVGFNPTVAVTPGGPLGEDHVRPIDVYLKRKPQPTIAEATAPQPSAAQPSAAQPQPVQPQPVQPAAAEPAEPSRQEPPVAVPQPAPVEAPQPQPQSR